MRRRAPASAAKEREGQSRVTTDLTATWFRSSLDLAADFTRHLQHASWLELSVPLRRMSASPGHAVAAYLSPKRESIIITTTINPTR